MNRQLTMGCSGVDAEQRLPVMRWLFLVVGSLSFGASDECRRAFDGLPRVRCPRHMLLGIVPRDRHGVPGMPEDRYGVPGMREIRYGVPGMRNESRLIANSPTFVAWRSFQLRYPTSDRICGSDEENQRRMGDWLAGKCRP